jgi:uncharacterized protein (TIGR03382 family)
MDSNVVYAIVLAWCLVIWVWLGWRRRHRH